MLESEPNFVARGSQAECDFASVINFSFYRFGIRSCLTTNHKQTLRCHRAFWVSRQHNLLATDYG